MWRISERGNKFTKINGYFVCVYHKDLADGRWWRGLFKPEGTDGEPYWVIGSFRDVDKAKDAAIKELGEHLAARMLRVRP
jgi:hypothetical protein